MDNRDFKEKEEVKKRVFKKLCIFGSAAALMLTPGICLCQNNQYKEDTTSVENINNEEHIERIVVGQDDNGELIFETRIIKKPIIRKPVYGADFIPFSTLDSSNETEYSHKTK